MNRSLYLLFLTIFLIIPPAKSTFRFHCPENDLYLTPNGKTLSPEINKKIDVIAERVYKRVSRPGLNEWIEVIANSNWTYVDNILDYNIEGIYWIRENDFKCGKLVEFEYRKN